MMVLVTYDVSTETPLGAKRLRQVARHCQNYGQRVQNSVFECVLTECQFVSLRNAIKKVINEKEDSVRFYFLGKNWQRRIESIGKETSFDVTGDLIF